MAHRVLDGAYADFGFAAKPDPRIANLQRVGLTLKTLDLSRAPYGLGIDMLTKRGNLLGNKAVTPFIEILETDLLRDGFARQYLQPILGRTVALGDVAEEQEEQDFEVLEGKSITQFHAEFKNTTDLHFIPIQISLGESADGSPNLSLSAFAGYINAKIDEVYAVPDKSDRIIIPCKVTHDLPLGQSIEHNVSIVIDTNQGKGKPPRILFFDSQKHSYLDTKHNKIGKIDSYPIAALVNLIKDKLTVRSGTPADHIRVLELNQKVQRELFVCGDHNIVLYLQAVAGFEFEHIREDLQYHRDVENKVRCFATSILKIGYDRAPTDRERIRALAAAQANAGKVDEDDGWEDGAGPA